MIRNMLLLMAIAVSPVANAQNDGMPFGRISNVEADKLFAFAKASNFDLESELKLAYTKDKSALGRVFCFSLKFNALDSNARAYGQIIYSSLLNLGEGMGVDSYAQVLNKQSPEVQQRIRDFLYYPFTKIPKEHQADAFKETQKAYPTLFPNGFVFGYQDPIFQQ